jgi:branched-chain amino acid transport system substrate-binding protein
MKKWLSCAILFSFWNTGCTPQQTNPPPKEKIRIGMIMPFTPAQTYATALVNAAQMAVDDINAGGGLLGKELELATADYENNATAIASLAALEAQGVISFVGPTGTGTFTGAARGTVKMDGSNGDDGSIAKGYLMVSTGATGMSITDLNDNGLCFRTAPRDDEQGKVAANFAYTNLGKRKAAIITINSLYGNSLSQVFKAEFERLGGQVAIVEQYPEPPSNAPPNTPPFYQTYDFTTHLDNVFATAPDLFYMTSTGADRGKILTQLAQSTHPAITVMGADGMYSRAILPAQLTTAASRVDNNLVVTTPFTESDSFMQAYKDRFGIDPDPYVGHAYDAIFLMALAAEQAKSEVSAEIAAQMIAVSKDGEKVRTGAAEWTRAVKLIKDGSDVDFDGASGRIEFNDAGDVTSGTYGVFKVVSGEFVAQATVSF